MIKIESPDAVAEVADPARQRIRHHVADIVLGPRHRSVTVARENS